MNKNSLFFTITIFFIVLIITAHLIVYIGYNITKQQQIDLLVTKYMKTFHQIERKLFKGKRPPPPPAHLINKNENSFIYPFRPPPPPEHKKIDIKSFEKELKNYDLSLSNIEISILEKYGTLLSKERDWKLFEYKGYNYFFRQTPFSSFIIKDNMKLDKKTEHIIILTILFNILFMAFYIFLIKKLKPLHSLKNNISKFSKGDLNIDTSCSGKDEISAVSNEFNNAITQIRTLTQSRNLFLRNIMHELKTPITKGLLIANMMKEDNSKKSLEKLFFRLEYLINEFAKIEKFTSNNISINPKEYRVIDIIDEALDILLLDSWDINLEVNCNKKLNVDFEMFSLVIKNLIDNAIKYSDTKPKVAIYENHIDISSIGNKLEKPIDSYNKPFNRKYETSQKGLGLGLYIVKNILDIHNLNLEYKYENKTNIFRINY